MKFIGKIFILTLVLAFASCDQTELDLLDNPNAITPENANVNDLYNNVQISFGNFYESVWDYTAGMSRMISATGAYDYQNAYQPTAFNGAWNQAYAQLFPDVEAIITLAEDRGLDIHAGSAKIMKAYALIALTDVFGRVPNSEALKGTDIISPAADDGASVYTNAEALLDEAIAQLTGTAAAAPIYDNFYGGDADSWVTFAKTLKLRIAVTTRLVDGSAASKINSLLADGDLIDEEDEDFQFNYSSERNNPNSRHPFYNDSYEAADGTYQSTYYMWLLRSEKLDANDNPVVDPRIRFYFYRQTDNGNQDDVTLYSCHFSNFPDQDEKPAHWDAVDPRIPYCIASGDGYWGRDHLNNEGIPPDGPERTVYGLYPAGGQFDDDSFGFTQQLGTTGGLGEGINPIWLSSFTDFIRAEAALILKTNDDARALLESGVRKSIKKVIGFTSLVPSTMSREVDVRGEFIPVEDLFVPTDEDIQAYVDVVLANYDAAATEDDKLDVLMKEYYIALYGNGLEAYNMYRRTGKPNNMAPSLEPGPGAFIRTFFYPADHINLNATATQKALTEQVFWDNNPADFVY